MLNPRTLMHRSIRRVEADLERIGTIVRTVERELDELPSTRRGRDLVAGMKEQLGEVHTRLEGLYAFVLACEQKAARPPESPLESDDIDVWL